MQRSSSPAPRNVLLVWMGRHRNNLSTNSRCTRSRLETQAEELRRAHVALEESRDKYLDLYEFAPTGYFTLTDKALIAGVNLTGAMLLGVERGNLLNTPFSKFVAAQDSDQWHLYFIHVREDLEKQTCTLMLKRGDGSAFPARLESIQLTGLSDGVTTVRVAVSDVSDIRNMETALRTANKKTHPALRYHPP